MRILAWYWDFTWRIYVAMMKIRIITAFLVIFLTGELYASSPGSDPNDEELVVEYKTRVNNAAPDDWMTFAECAEALVSKRIASDEAENWIGRSIAIRETAYNRTIMGDYLVLKGKIREAQAEYVRAIELAKLENRKNEIGKIQWKIMISMGIENFNRYHMAN